MRNNVLICRKTLKIPCKPFVHPSNISEYAVTASASVKRLDSRQLPTTATTPAAVTTTTMASVPAGYDVFVASKFTIVLFLSLPKSPLKTTLSKI
ncbi:hypothetical protein HZH68_001233 [Vespula germanica]|uniref:Uncharacterized protein n=1 Tax=Vespula germanica TaxID=30212 RepID=A0A834NV76_VESGE|nr:hypothetical protein HZH68_001233 [Vespula germanica]